MRYGLVANATPTALSDCLELPSHSKTTNQSGTESIQDLTPLSNFIGKQNLTQVDIMHVTLFAFAFVCFGRIPEQLQSYHVQQRTAHRKHGFILSDEPRNATSTATMFSNGGKEFTAALPGNVLRVFRLITVPVILLSAKYCP